MKKKESVMDLMDLLKERYSVRKFSEKTVEDEKLTQILEAGRLAPTAVNFQPQRIIALKSKEALAKLKNCTRYHFDAPVALIVCYDNTVSWKRGYDNHDMGEVDAAIVTTQMLLEIANLGLGTTWVGHFDPSAVVREFELPENIVPVAILPIGYPADDAEPNPRHFERLELKDTVKFL